MSLISAEECVFEEVSRGRRGVFTDNVVKEVMQLLRLAQ